MLAHLQHNLKQSSLSVSLARGNQSNIESPALSEGPESSPGISDWSADCSPPPLVRYGNACIVLSITGLANSRMAATPAETNRKNPTCSIKYTGRFGLTSNIAASHTLATDQLSEKKCPKKSRAATVSSAVIYNHRHWLVATLKTMPTASLSRNPAGESTSKPPTMSFSFSSCCCALHTSCLAGLWLLQSDLGSADVTICTVLCIATCFRIRLCADRDNLALQERCRLCLFQGHALLDGNAVQDCGVHRQNVLVIC